MFKEKIIELLKNNMTESCFKLWQGINQMLPDIWELPTSSTGRWHKKMNGDIPTQSEHVYNMLYTATKLFSMFDIQTKTRDSDTILLAIVLHDCLKYGKMGNRKHTDSQHDKEAADLVCQNKDTFLKIFSKEQFFLLEEAIRFHSGRWSTDVGRGNKFSFRKVTPITMFVHMLDMLDTNDLIQTDVR